MKPIVSDEASLILYYTQPRHPSCPTWTLTDVRVNPSTLPQSLPAVPFGHHPPKCRDDVPNIGEDGHLLVL